MHYTLLISALAATTLATPWVNIEVNEPASVEESGRHGGHHDRDRRGHHHKHRGSFWSSLWSPYNGGRGRGGERERIPYDDRYLLNQPFNYECIIEGNKARNERLDDRDCCREVGGRLSDLRGHCIVRDMMTNPRDDWRQCALRDRNIEFADCYLREQREVDHDLDRKRDPHQGETSRDRNRNRNGRHGHNGHNDNDRKQHVMEDEDMEIDGRREYECRLQMDNDQQRQALVRRCCEQETRGRVEEGNNVCLIDRRRDIRHFENCAFDSGAEDAECSRYSRHEEM